MIFKKRCFHARAAEIGLIFLLSALVYFGLVYQWHQMVVDDAFISFRFAENLATGLGFSWNADGEPTEGFTSLLQVLLLAVGIIGGIPPQLGAFAISVVAFLTMGLMIALTIRREFWVISPFAAGALGIFIVDRVSAVHTTSGMETLLFASLLCVSYFFAVAFLNQPNWRNAILLGVFTFSAALARPEGVLYGGAVYSILLIYFGSLRLRKTTGNRELRLLVAVVVATALAGVFYLGWKSSYYGYLLPNSYYVKSDQIGLVGLGDVLFFIGHVVVWFLPLVVLALAYTLAFPRARLSLWPLSGRGWTKVLLTLVPPLLGLAYYSTITHEVGFVFRFSVPTYFYLAVAIAALMSALTGNAETKGLPRFTAFVVVVALVVFQGALLQGFLRTNETWPSLETRDLSHLTIANAIGGTNLGSEGTIITAAAGEIPYVSGFNQVDPVGLTSNYLSGRTPQTLEEREAYLWSQGADVFEGFVPPATEGAEGPADDPVMDTAYVSLALENRQVDGIMELNFPEDPDVLHSRMRELRDEWVWLGYTDWPGWNWTRLRRFIYVRNDSPHRDLLISNLTPIISAKPGEIDLNDRPPSTLTKQKDLSLSQELRQKGLILVPR